jgi:hypothetical protein
MWIDKNQLEDNISRLAYIFSAFIMPLMTWNLKMGGPSEWPWSILKIALNSVFLVKKRVLFPYYFYFSTYNTAFLIWITDIPYDLNSIINLKVWIIQKYEH